MRARRTSVAVVVFAQVALGLALSEAAAVARPTLTGVVKGPAGDPIRNAIVFISTARPRTGTSLVCPSCYLDCRKRVETNARGEFAIADLDPTLLFEVGAAAEGYQATFQARVDPATGPVAIKLESPPALPTEPRRIVRARLLGPDGAPVLGAAVQVTGYRIERPNGGWEGRFGAIGVAPMVTGSSGRLAFGMPVAVDSVFLSVDARGLAPKVFGRVAAGGQENELKLGIGRAIKGRLVRDGQPVAGATLGAAQVERNNESFVGERTTQTDAGGRFLLLNLPTDEPLALYGKLDSLGRRGALAARELTAAGEASVADMGDVALDAGFELTGRIVLADGKPLPAQTRILLGREPAWDTSEQALAGDGSFRFSGVPRETITLSINVPGYELSTENASLYPDYADSRQSLVGGVEADAELQLVLVPAGGRTPAAPPRSAEDWSALNARQAAVRAKPLGGVPVTR